MDADTLPPMDTYEAFVARMNSREGLQFDIPQLAPIGFDDLKRSQQKRLVETVFLYLHIGAKPPTLAP